MAEELNSLEYTPTWVVAGVCFVIVLLSLLAERGLHKLGKYLMHKSQDALYEALQKLKEELMLLGFISLLLTVSQGAISHICIPPHLATYMLPCKITTETNNHKKYLHGDIKTQRRLLSTAANEVHCTREGKVQLFSLEALHQLHIFVFILAVVHVIFCATTMVLGGARIRQWKSWEDLIRNAAKTAKGAGADPAKRDHERHHHLFIQEHAKGYWKKSAIISWLISFFKQFYGSVTKSDYIALRQGFIMKHCPNKPDFDFHKYMMRTLEIDFKKIVSISWYLWLFVVIFLLLNIEGWHTYFWLAFLPLILLLLVGAKLEHIITRLAQEVVEKIQKNEAPTVEPSDKHYWFGRPVLVLHLIHFILFQNSFELAFFFWIWSTYGFHSCIMEKLGYIVPRLIMGVIVQALCSYSTFPLYALVSQMGTKFKKGMFADFVHSGLHTWLDSRGPGSQLHRLATESSHSAEQEMAVEGGCAVPITELSSITQLTPSLS